MSKPCWIPIVCLLAVLPLTRAHGADGPWTDVMVSYCLECHDSLSEKGGLNFEPLLDEPFPGHTETWERVLRQIDAHQMPPLGETRPSDEEYEAVAAALVKRLDAAAADSPDPGRTDAIRRLTRTEYENAVRDLLALEIDASELLPADESSHGFDNITVGELSPALLDRYLSAARKISRMAVGSPLRVMDSRTVRLEPDLTQEERVPGLPLGTRGGGWIEHHFPRSGAYEIQVRLTRDRNDLIEGMNDEHEMIFLVDGEEAGAIELIPPQGREEHTGYDANLKISFQAEAGPARVGVTFLKNPTVVEETLRQPYQAHFNYHRHPRHSPAIYEISVTGPFEDEGVVETPSRERIFSVRPSENRPPGEAAREILGQLLRRAWRRPVDEADIARIYPFFEEGFAADEGSIERDFEEGIESALAAILVSPEFLFRTAAEPEGVAPGTPYQLPDLELASRLSFFLWSSLPDEELLELAERGGLSDPDVLEAQARRMLDDPRAESLVTNFADQWLYLRNLETITPNGRLFPDFDHNLREAFRKETELLFAEMMREDRSVLHLLDPGATWLNERLAKHYGVPHVYGSRFRRVETGPESRRGGLLRHGSLLTVTSYATRTSPVIRGHWILENLIGTPPPPAPPNVPTLEENNVSADLPIRERLAAHREQSSCASCHNVMDPIGFALENFDAVGRWRTLDGGNPVDATGSLPDGSEFEGVEGLEGVLLEQPERFVRTMAEKLLTYGLGRGVEPSDGPAVRAIVREAARDDYRFSSLVSAVVRSVPFRMRIAGDPEGVPESGH